MILSFQILLEKELSQTASWEVNARKHNHQGGIKPQNLMGTDII